MDFTRITAIRHGETAWNVDTRIQGQLDIELNDTGHWQARQVANALLEEECAAIYSSDLRRALATAQAIGEQLGLTPVRTLGLRERAFGAFEGKTWAEIERDHPDDARRWRQREPDWSPEGGETLRAVRERVDLTCTEIARRHPGEHVIVVAHGGVLDVMYRLATRLEIQAPRSWELGNASINRLLWTEEGFALVGWGDVRHLEDQAHRDEHTA